MGGEDAGESRRPGWWREAAELMVPGLPGVGAAPLLAGVRKEGGGRGGIERRRVVVCGRAARRSASGQGGGRRRPGQVPGGGVVPERLGRGQDGGGVSGREPPETGRAVAVAVAGVGARGSSGDGSSNHRLKRQAATPGTACCKSYWRTMDRIGRRLVN